jgi:hypothetical protein
LNNLRDKLRDNAEVLTKVQELRENTGVITNKSAPISAITEDFLSSLDGLGSNIKPLVENRALVKQHEDSLDLDSDLSSDIKTLIKIKALRKQYEDSLDSGKETLKITVRINGREDATISVPMDTKKEDMERFVLEDHLVKALIGGRELKKFHYMKSSQGNIASIFI